MRNRIWLVITLLLVVLLAALLSWNAFRRAPSDPPPIGKEADSQADYTEVLQGKKIHPVDLSDAFAGYKGCFAMTDLGTGEYTVYNREQCEQRLTPASTFKLMISLIGLETGAVKDGNSAIPWDGHPYPFPEWNRDHTLSSALANSVNWYFQKLSGRIGEKELQRYVDAVSYGNGDLSGGLEQFWLGSSLKISAAEQTKLLADLYKGSLPFSSRTTDLVKQMMVLRTDGSSVLAGKTGTCNSTRCFSEVPENDTLGWFVGYVKKDGAESVFALNVGADKGANGSTAKQIAMDVLTRLNWWSEPAG